MQKADDERPTKTLAGGAVLRPAVEADVPELLRLVRALATYKRNRTRSRRLWTVIARSSFRARTPTGFAEVAEVDGRLVGMAFWYVTFSTWSGRNGIWLEDFFVEPESRGQGLGHHLLSRLARICVLRDYPRLEWWVLDWNQSAIDFYQSRGARGMSEWTHYRLDGAELDELGQS